MICKGSKCTRIREDFGVKFQRVCRWYMYTALLQKASVNSLCFEGFLEWKWKKSVDLFISTLVWLYNVSVLLVRRVIGPWVGFGSGNASWCIWSEVPSQRFSRTNCCFLGLGAQSPKLIIIVFMDWFLTSIMLNVLIYVCWVTPVKGNSHIFRWHCPILPGLTSALFCFGITRPGSDLHFCILTQHKCDYTTTTSNKLMPKKIIPFCTCLLLSAMSKRSSTLGTLMRFSGINYQMEVKLSKFILKSYPWDTAMAAFHWYLY